MNRSRHKPALTLIEILVVVAVIIILAGLVIHLGSRVANQSKERLAKSTMALLSTALEQFRDYGYPYYNSTMMNVDYSRFAFPIDCNSFNKAAIQTNMEYAMNLSAGSVNLLITPGVHDDANDSGGEVMYFFLSQVPQCRATLEKIDKSLITDMDKSNQSQTIRITRGGVLETYPLYRVTDPWKHTFRYNYYNPFVNPPQWWIARKRSFPLIVSAGPDGKFGTADDIRSQ